MHITIRDHLLVDQTLSDGELGKMLTQTIAGVVWTLPQHMPVLVWWKRAFQIKPWQEIGDGMAVMCVYERMPLSFPLEKLHCLQALLSYSDYDEEKNATQYFLYKSQHTSEELAWMSSWLSTHFPTLTLKKERFVEIQVPPSQQLPALMLEQPQQICSWLFGLSLAYGTWQIQNDRLVRILLTIPQVGSLSTIAVVCEEIKTVLRDLGVPLVLQSLPGKLNDTLQISLQDPELLALFRSRYTWDPLLQDTQYTTWLEVFLLQQGIDPITAGLIAHSVLKLREK